MITGEPVWQISDPAGFEKYVRPSLDRHAAALRTLANRYADAFERQTVRVKARTPAEAVTELGDVLEESMALRVELRNAGFPTQDSVAYTEIMKDLARVLLRDAFIEAVPA